MAREITFNFEEQLAWSNIQELAFTEIYKTHKLRKSQADRRWDFNTESGLQVELKTDTHDCTKSSNFFMERWGNMEKKTPGGPWRAAQDGVDIWIYWFPKNRVYYEFTNLEELTKVLDKMTDKLPVIGIKNTSWITGGYKIPRDMLMNQFRRVTY